MVVEDTGKQFGLSQSQTISVNEATGSVQISFTPKGALVIFDGEEGITPLLLTDINPEIKIHYSGSENYNNLTKNIVVKPLVCLKQWMKFIQKKWVTYISPQNHLVHQFSPMV